MGRQLPDDVRCLYASWNGAASSAGWLGAAGAWLSLDELVAKWTSEQEFVSEPESVWYVTEDRIRGVSFDPARIPLTFDESATAGAYVDLVPGPKGSPGQIIHNVDEADYVVLATSFEDLLRRYHAALVDGRLVIEAQDDEEYPFILTAAPGIGPWGEWWEALAIATPYAPVAATTSSVEATTTSTAKATSKAKTKATTKRADKAKVKTKAKTKTKVKAKVKAKTKAKVKVKVKVKVKTTAKPKAMAKSNAKRSATPRSKAKR